MCGACASLVIVTLAITAEAAAQTNDAFARALDAQWDFGKPAVSEQRFRAELAKWPPDSAQAQEARTQVARALGLQRKFGDAHAVLDTVDAKLADMPPHVRVRYLLERGRVFNSAGEPQRAVPLFTDALALAARDHDEFYAVDAAHMLGIAAPPQERLAWNLRALALAEAAADTRARDWRASLYHNIGWTYFDDGDASRALDFWQKALVVEFDTLGEPDGYVYEELAEIALARGDPASAQPWAAKAHAALKDDADLAGSVRLARLADVAAGKPLAAKP